MRKFLKKRLLPVLLAVCLFLCMTGCGSGVSDADTKRITALTEEISGQLDSLTEWVEANPALSVSASRLLLYAKQTLTELQEEPETDVKLQGLEALSAQLAEYLENLVGSAQS